MFFIDWTFFSVYHFQCSSSEGEDLMKFRENPNFKNKEADKTTRRSFLKKTIKGISTIFLTSYIGLIPMACKKTPTTPETPEPPKIGNLTGNITGLIQGITITSGTAYLKKYSSETKEYTATINNGTFQIQNIQSPQGIRRIGLESSQGINRETNITLQPGDNNAEINMIEADHISGYYYKDYDTVNSDGAKLDKNIEYKVYFYNKSLWKWNGSDYVVINTVPLIYTKDAIEKCKDVLKNDLTAMSKGAYKYKGIKLESNGAQVPGIPIAANPKKGWLVIYIKDQMSPLGTSTFRENYNIIGACLSIDYSTNVEQIIGCRRAYSQDICEWAGFVDLLQKNNVSIFTDGEKGYQYPDYPTDFDLNYIAVIKHNRLPGHKSQDNIPDYDPIGSTGSGIYVTHSLPINPSIYAPNNSITGFLKDPSGRRYAEQLEAERKYQQWLHQENKKKEIKDIKKNF